MSYRKVRTQHDETSLWLTNSTYCNSADKEKTMSVNRTAIISSNYSTTHLQATEKTKHWRLDLRSALFWDFTQRWLVVTDRRFGTICPVLRVTHSMKILLGSLDLEHGTDRLSRNVGIYPSRLCNFPEEQRPHLRRGWSLIAEEIWCFKGEFIEDWSPSDVK
jgi:hypothetical protein